MKLHQDSGEVTVVIDVSYSAPIDEVKKFHPKRTMPIY